MALVVKITGFSVLPGFQLPQFGTYVCGDLDANLPRIVDESPGNHGIRDGRRHSIDKLAYWKPY